MKPEASSERLDNIVVVSTFPPTHCGIGRHGAQLVDALRNRGHVVTTVAVDQESGADAKLNLLGGFRLLRLARYLHQRNRLILNYHPSFFFRSQQNLDAIVTSLAFSLLSLLSRGKITVICHETALVRKDGSILAKILYRCEKYRWRFTPHIQFHSRRELGFFADHYKLECTNASVVAPGAYYRPYATVDCQSARKVLGLDGIAPDATLFLCIGFIQYAKGFDRIVDVFNSAAVPHNIYLYIVGSLRLEEEESAKYLNTLKQKAARKDCIRIIDRFVADEEFDTWISASDYVVLPYRAIWSSAVAERAKLYQKPRILSAVGGLEEQVTKGDYVFRTDEELATILGRLFNRP